MLHHYLLYYLISLNILLHFIKLHFIQSCNMKGLTVLLKLLIYHSYLIALCSRNLSQRGGEIQNCIE